MWELVALAARNRAVFEQLEKLAQDPILGLIDAYRNDPRSQKVDLGAGVVVANQLVRHLDADLGEVDTRFGATVAPDEIDALLLDTYRIHPVLGDGWFGTAVLSWPVSPDKFSLTARAGFFAWESDIDVEVVQGGTGSVSDDDSGTDMLYGIGFEWMLNEQWSITGDWERYDLKDWVDVPSVGVKFRF